MVVKPSDKAKKPAKKGAKVVKKDIAKEKKEKSGVVDEDFEVDEAERYSGECVMYDKSRGFGFIKMETTGIVPDDKLMVHWRELQSEDRWPYLMRGTKVEFGLKKLKEQGTFSLKAKEVSCAGGEKIALQEARDEQTEFIGDRNMRFLGNVKWYDFKKGFGYVKLQEGYDIGEDVPTELRVDRQEINSGDDAPRLSNEMEIEFGIQKSKKGNYSCYNVTLAGGEEIARVVAEGRKGASEETFNGKIHFWQIRDGWGFISPESLTKLPDNFQEALGKELEKHKKKAEKASKEAPDAPAIYFRRSDKANREDRLEKGDSVTFKLYEDARGVGACEVLKV